MRAQRALVIMVSILVSMPASPVAGGQHVLDATQLVDTLNTEMGRANAQRAAIRDALGQPRSRRIASALGLDRREVDAAVEALAGADLENAARVATEINPVNAINAQAVSGGPSSITVSTTTIVVILLILILVVVTVK